MSGEDDELSRELMGMVQDLREEVKELRQENEELRNGDDRPVPPSNQEIVDRFLESRNLAESTMRPLELTIRYFREHTDDKPFLGVTSDDILDFARNWGKQGEMSTKSMVAYLRRVKRMYDWMMTKKWGPRENPVIEPINQYRNENKSRLRRAGQNTGTVVQPEEYAEFVSWNREPKASAMLVIAAKTGLRRKELAALKVEDINLEEKKLYNCSPKGVGEVRLPREDADHKFFDEETKKVIIEWLEQRQKVVARQEADDEGWLFVGHQGGNVRPTTISRWWDKATERAGNGLRQDGDTELAEMIEDMTPHDARRCFTSWLNWNGCPRDVISTLRGDADEDMVALYTRHGEDKVRQAYEDSMPSIVY